jgi:Spy/CpxP family protein refolding chaperone
VSPWKVILATLVIFIAGLVTGTIGVARFVKPRPTSPLQPMQPWMLREQFRVELDRRLDLTPRQSERIERVMREGQERVREIWSLVGPEIQEELRSVREDIRRELTPEQRRRFEQLMRERRFRPLEMDRPPGERPFRPGPRDRFPPPPGDNPPPRDRDSSP